MYNNIYIVTCSVYNNSMQAYMHHQVILSSTSPALTMRGASRLLNKQGIDHVDVITVERIIYSSGF